MTSDEKQLPLPFPPRGVTLDEYLRRVHKEVGRRDDIARRSTMSRDRLHRLVLEHRNVVDLLTERERRKENYRLQVNEIPLGRSLELFPYRDDVNEMVGTLLDQYQNMLLSYMKNELGE